MIRCDTDAEREALAHLLRVAVQIITCDRRTHPKKEIAELEKAHDALFHAACPEAVLTDPETVFYAKRIPPKPAAP